METKFWYRDNWSGQRKSFSTLKDAKKEASKETGNSIAIYNGHGDLVLLCSASGYTPS